MKVKTIARFNDRETGDKREPGGEFEVKDTRGKELIRRGYVEEVKPGEKSKTAKPQE